MHTLLSLLEGRSRRELAATAAIHDLPFNAKRPKRQELVRLHENLTTNGHLVRAWRGLSQSERASLAILHAAGSQLPLHEFMAMFGDIRPYRPWDPEAPRYPWKQPISVAEKLWYLAFIGIIPGENGHPDRVCAPVEVLALLPPLPVPGPVVRDVPPPLATPDALLGDVAVLLGMLLYEDVRPGWGRC